VPVAPGAAPPRAGSPGVPGPPGPASSLVLADVPDEQRSHRWRDVMTQAVGAGSLVVEPGAPAWAQVMAAGLSRVTVTRLRSGPFQVRSAPGGSGPADGSLCLCLLLAGKAAFRQEGRRSRLDAPGHVLWDPGLPFGIGVAAGPGAAAELVLVRFPRDVLPFPPAQVREVLAVAGPPDALPAGVLTAVVRQLTDPAVPVRPPDSSGLGTVVIALVTQVVGRLGRAPDAGPAAATTQAGPAPEEALFLQVRAFVEQHLGDPGLSPAGIAATHHVSLRHLYRVFEARGETVAGWLRRRRLERCRADLEDPACAERSVRSIGARWGFPHEAHFTRLFSAAYGQPPGAYRRAAATRR
jgi:AraC-like DNA-binding protein